MDSNAVVLEISSDEEGGWNGHDAKGSIDGGDDHNWIAELLDEVNRDDCVYDDGSDDSDEVVVVSEVLPKRPRKKLTSKSSLICLDDDCVVLEHDPDKPLEVRSDDPIHRDEDDDSDDILVVSEKGQVACRDYPHPRHLCIKFPFSSTPIQSHCDQCYCYVCDLLAPCMYWGNGSECLDHCHATDKDDFWKLERQNSKNSGKVADAPLSNQLPPTNLVPPTFQNQVPRSHPIHFCPLSSNFGAPNIINQNQTSPVLLPRNKFQPSLVLQQLIRTSSCTIPREILHHNYNLATPFHKPVFKRTVSSGVVPATYRYSDSSHRASYRNFKYSGASPVNTSVPFSPQTLTFEEPVPRSNTQFDLSLNFQTLVNSDSYVETPVLFQPLPVPLVSQPQGQSCLPNYSIPSGASQQESQRQSSTVDPKTFPDISWPQSQTNQQQQQPASQSSLVEVEVEGVGPVSEPSVATGSGGLVDYEYDNWMFNNQPSEPSFPGSVGFNELSPQPAYMDGGIIFDF